MYDVVTFGETMVRLSPPGFRRLEQTDSLEMSIGGTELNTAAALARLGRRVCWVSKLVDNGLGRFIANKGRELGVDMSRVIWAHEGRIGTYFIEQAVSPRPISLIYDRKDSAINTLQPGEIDWPSLFAGTRLFHTTGINPALSPAVARETKVAMLAAKAAGCKVSFDPNMRFNLWTVEEARRAFLELVPLADILFSPAEALDLFFGIKGEPFAAAQEARRRFGLALVVMGRRESLGQVRGAWSSAVVGERVWEGERREFEIVDRIGTGDAYAAGFFHGYLDGDLAKAVAWGDAMCALKHTIPGDLPWLTASEVAELVAGSTRSIRR
ncbi:MAG: sugar kinase [Chloroflexota bacterium]